MVLLVAVAFPREMLPFLQGKVSLFNLRGAILSPSYSLLLLFVFCLPCCAAGLCLCGVGGLALINREGLSFVSEWCKDTPAVVCEEPAWWMDHKCAIPEVLLVQEGCLFIFLISAILGKS